MELDKNEPRDGFHNTFIHKNHVHPFNSTDWRFPFINIISYF